jgi:TRAP-type mannitol/chloroaromatic compound transport system permease small subunit
MAVDFLLMPLLKKWADAKAPQTSHAEADAALAEHGVGETTIDADKHISPHWNGILDRLSFYAGEFVSYWAVIAVFVYYFEVVSRYVFNSPTNWAHEGMFLMFGMQYLIAGSYAMMTESHVRVDIFYAKFGPRRKAIIDILTSVFFFIFAGVLFWTSWIFASDATAVLPNGEISTSEWAISIWPIKWMMVVGAVLLILQGVSKLAEDIRTLATGDDGTGGTRGAAAEMRGAA